MIFKLYFIFFILFQFWIIIIVIERSYIYINTFLSCLLCTLYSFFTSFFFGWVLKLPLKISIKKKNFFMNKFYWLHIGKLFSIQNIHVLYFYVQYLYVYMYIVLLCKICIRVVNHNTTLTYLNNFMLLDTIVEYEICIYKHMYNILTLHI